MCELLLRSEITNSKRIIGSFIANMQKDFFDNDSLKYYQESNEEHLYLEMFDLISYKIEPYKVYNKIISINHSDIRTFASELSKSLIKLFEYIDSNEFVILSHYKSDLFGNRKNKYPFLVESYKKLEVAIGGKTYKEAIKIGVNELEEFIGILFWLTRCDMSVPEYIFLFDSNEKVQIHICKYGNVHLAEFNTENLTPELLRKFGWLIIEGQEHDNFSGDSLIEGRQVKV